LALLIIILLIVWLPAALGEPLPLVRAGLATATSERVVAGKREIEVARRSLV
jgi:hypothetical protein